jgi:hypothetical protein
MKHQRKQTDYYEYLFPTTSKFLDPSSHFLFQDNYALLSTAGALCYTPEGRGFDFP